MRRERSHSDNPERSTTNPSKLYETQIQADPGGGGIVTQIENAGLQTIAKEWNDRLALTITADELKTMVYRGVSTKAPERDAISLDFFKTNWETMHEDTLELFNKTYMDGKMREQQKHGLVICFPKTSKPSTPAEYRPITLLNTDY